MREPRTFEFMHWAKRWVGKLPYCLGMSGTTPVDPSEVAPASAGPAGPNYYGTAELKEAVAAAYGTDPDSVLVSDGTSLANYNVLAALAGPGDGVLVETPAYPALAEIPRFHGARVDPLARRPENDWIPSLERIARRAADRSSPPLRAVALSRLHNPTGADLPDDFLRELAALAERHDFHVLMDEVYLDFVADARSSHAVSPRFLVTSSLTKVYGFGGLRVGWVLGDPAVLAPVKELSFYLAVDGAAASQATAVRVLAERDRFRERACSVAEQGIAIVQAWVEERADVRWTRPAGGLNAFLELGGVSDTRAFADDLRRRREVNVAEGEFFGMPGWIRVCCGGPPDALREGLRRIGEAMDERGRSRAS
ncbi:MAG TPA: pyridoxal phosphate-dependent aminotransferase [bacterium]|nr:pyridoxal phosphate-dependent aminotransferase [bacterium]